MIRNGIRVGRVFGIDLILDTSWILIFAFIVWTLTSVFEAWHPSWTSGTVLVVSIVTTFGFFASVVAHELAHALVAKLYGLPVTDITLHLFGGVAKLEREPPTPAAELLIAAAGPIASVMLGVAMLAVAPVTSGSASTHTLLTWLGPVNIALGAFNLMPGFPMDGGRILHAVLWQANKSSSTATRWTTSVGQAIGLGFIALGALMAIGLRVPFFGRGIVAATWSVFIGLFVRGAAKQHRASAEVREALDGVTVAALMRPRTGAAGVQGNRSIRSLVDGEFAASNDGVMPVLFGERLVGMVAFVDIATVPPTEWDEHTVREIMRPVGSVPSVAPSLSALEAFRTMATTGLPGAPVVEDGELVGMLFARDIARWVELHGHAPKRRFLPA